MGQLSIFLVENAISYRNSIIAIRIIPHLKGRPLTEKIIRYVIEPYIAQVNSSLPTSIKKLIWNRFEEFLSNVREDMLRNSHMHSATDCNFLTQESADALLTLFINKVYLPGDLGLQAKDLFPYT